MRINKCSSRARFSAKHAKGTCFELCKEQMELSLLQIDFHGCKMKKTTGKNKEEKRCAQSHHQLG